MTIERHMGFQVGPARVTFFRKTVDQFPYKTKVRDIHIKIQPTETVEGGVKVLGLEMSSEVHSLGVFVKDPDTLALESLGTECQTCQDLDGTIVSRSAINDDPLFVGRLSWRP